MKKMIVRADDVGYTVVNNIGAFESIENGVVTSADVMLECPGTIDALERLKDMPWISVGWHPHFWGSPVLPFSQVPDLVDERTGHFRTDIRKADVPEDQLLAEMFAQMERCEKYLGRVPDVAGELSADSAFGRAQIRVCDELGIARNYVTKEGREGMIYPLEKYKDAGIYTLNGGIAYKDLFTDSISEQEKNYDPYLYYAEDRGGMWEKYEQGFKVVTQSWHPGYLDYYMYQLGDQGPARNKFGAIRTKDVEALCSERLKKWIKDNKIVLVSYTDALFGRNAYQNHLRFTGSDLYMK